MMRWEGDSPAAFRTDANSMMASPMINAITGFKWCAGASWSCSSLSAMKSNEKKRLS